MDLPRSEYGNMTAYPRHNLVGLSRLMVFCSSQCCDLAVFVLHNVSGKDSVSRFKHRTLFQKPIAQYARDRNLHLTHLLRMDEAWARNRSVIWRPEHQALIDRSQIKLVSQSSSVVGPATPS